MTIQPLHYAKALYGSTAGLSEKEAVKVISAFAARFSAIGLAPLLPKIIAALPEAAREAEGLQSVEIRSVATLTKKDVAQILEAMGIPEDQAEVSQIEDAAVTTGFRAATNARIIDHTLGARLQQLRQALTH